MKNPAAKIDIVRGDITTFDVDAIVNAANTTLLDGGGVDGAIHRAAGPELLAECRTLGGCQPDEAKLTRGHRLPARFCHSHSRPRLDAREARRTADFGKLLSEFFAARAVKHRIKTIAFPAISCGAYGYPIPEAMRIAVETTREFLATDAKIDKETFVVASDEILHAYQLLSGPTVIDRRYNN